MARVPLVVCLFLAIFASLPASGAARDDQCKADDISCLTAHSPDADDVGTVIHLDDDILRMCPTTRLTGGKIMGTLLWIMTSVAEKVFSRTSGQELFTPGWADDYTISSYEAVGQLMMRVYKTRNKDYVNIPTEWATNETVKVGNNYVPHHDVDGTPNFLWIEKWIPNFVKTLVVDPLYVPFLTCFFGGHRSLPFEDALDNPKLNTWGILKGGKYNNKKDWLLSFYNDLKTMSGDPSWPAQRMDFTGLYRNGDLWDDALESTMAFGGIGVHRVLSSTQEFSGEVLPFVIKVNDFNAFPVRPHFGKYGVDLYFTAEGLPAVLQTPDGKWVKRGEKDWQYWKFVWRSSLVTVITLCDHLYLTHFKASNTLARATRVALPPDHSLRRILSIFTFGAIFVNLQAQFVLAGKNAMLHRAVPFLNFEAFSDLVPEMIPDLAFAPGMEAIIDDKVFAKLPQKLQEAPFYADGKLVFNAFLKLVRQFSKSTGLREGLKSDEHVHRIIGMLRRQMEESRYQTNLTKAFLEKDLDVLSGILETRLAVYMFMVTAWHSHVGFVGDYYADPDLAGMSWKDGESYARPRQAIITSVINIFTSTKQPLLMEDYTHLFKGIGAGQDQKLTQMWGDFVKDLSEAKKVIDQRNAKRKVPNINMDPAILECSVAK